MVCTVFFYVPRLRHHEEFSVRRHEELSVPRHEEFFARRYEESSVLRHDAFSAHFPLIAMKSLPFLGMKNFLLVVMKSLPFLGMKSFLLVVMKSLPFFGMKSFLLVAMKSLPRHDAFSVRHREELRFCCHSKPPGGLRDVRISAKSPVGPNYYQVQRVLSTLTT
jgi:hypothetical protein